MTQSVRRFNFCLSLEQAERFEFMAYKEKLNQKEMFVKLINKYYADNHDPSLEKKEIERRNINKIRLQVMKANDNKTISENLELLAETILHLDPMYQNRLNHYIKVKQKEMNPTV